MTVMNQSYISSELNELIILHRWVTSPL